MTAKISRQPTTANEEVGEAESGPSRGLLNRVRRSSQKVTQHVGPWQYGSLLGTKVFLVLIVVGVFAGPAALTWTIAARQATPAASAVPAAGAVEDSRYRTEAAGAAINLVSMWLSAGQADSEALARLVANRPVQLTLPKRRPAPPAMVIVLDVVQTSPTAWDVLVAARGGQAVAGAAYRVLVATTSSGAYALTLPGQVPMPTELAGSFTADVRVIASNHPAAETVNGFAQALLSNSGDLSRWLAPSSALTPVTPKVCEQIHTTVSSPTELADVPSNAEEAAVLTDLTCRTSASTGRTFQYMLTLRGRDGRWEVASYTSALTPPAADPSTNSGTTPTPPNLNPTPTATTPGR